MHKILCELSPQSWLIQDLTLFLTWNGTLASPAACVFHFNLLEIIWCIFQIYSAHWESRFAQLASCCVLKYIFIKELISLCCSNIQQGFIFPQLWARLVLTPGMGITSMDSLVKARKQRGQIAQARELSEANRISIIFLDSYGVCSISTAEDFKKKKKKEYSEFHNQVWFGSNRYPDECYFPCAMELINLPWLPEGDVSPFPFVLC